mmetsp:Transcript_11731/g.38590  ORF Transcript_11731/g.38590 Transcript_11731/m.38590 type:complete len:644 (+) Transcript_11731:119-2050(+)
MMAVTAISTISSRVKPEEDAEKMSPKSTRPVLEVDETPLQAKINMDEASKFMIDPRSKFMRQWDVLTLNLLIFTSLVTPYEVAFLETTWTHPLYWINRCVDAAFIIDLVINFNLIYFDETELKYVTQRSRVVARYMKGFFLIDVVSIFPFDEIATAVGGGGAASNLKIFRVVRIFRLAKLLRILRSSRIFQRLENEMNINYGMIKLAKFLVVTALIAHWMACAWHLVVVVEEAHCSWVTSYFYGECGESNVNPNSLYVAALYLATMTISTVGYGDVTPETNAERVFLIFAMMIGASIYASVVGSICGIIASMNQDETEFQELMDSLNNFISDAKIESSLASRLRAYFRYRKHSSNFQNWHHLLNKMSPALRGQVAIQLNSGWISSVNFFRSCNDEMLIELAFAFNDETFPPHEAIIKPTDMSNLMYVVKKGLVSIMGKLRRMNMVVGEDMVWNTKERGYSCYALTYVDMHAITKVKLSSIIERYPKVQKDLRKMATRHIFREQVFGYTRMVRMLHSERYGDTNSERLRDLWTGFQAPPIDMTIAAKFSIISKVDPGFEKKLEKSVKIVQLAYRSYIAKRKQLREAKLSRINSGGGGGTGGVDGAGILFLADKIDMLCVLVEKLNARVGNLENELTVTSERRKI